MSSDNRTLIEIIFGLLSNALAYIVGYRKRHLNAKISETNYETKLEQLTQKRFFKLISEYEDLDKQYALLDKKYDQAVLMIEQLRKDKDAISVERDELRRQIALLKISKPN